MDCSRFPLLAYVLVLHLAHVPVPSWDPDNRVAGTNVAFAEWVVPTEPASNEWDFDLVLLGLDPPDDADEEPFDSTPECPELPYLVQGSSANTLRFTAAAWAFFEIAGGDGLEVRCGPECVVARAALPHESFFRPGTLRMFLAIANC